MKQQTSDRALRGTAWTVGLFYALIAFEFFYMATPFAVYFYGAYLPGLEWLTRIPGLAYLVHFYLPHYTASSSALVNAAGVLGALLTAIGLAGFIFGAVQVYSRKLLKRGAAVGGIYRFVRHPQYASLILAGVGMLLLWPRFLMVVFFVTMVFVYRGLASIEENECLRKYGQSYADYLAATPRFFPFKRLFHRSTKCAFSPKPLPTRIVVFLISYAAATALALGAATVLQRYSLNRLYTYENAESVFVSLVPIDKSVIESIAKAAAKDPMVREKLETAAGQGHRFINYVMPWEWSVSEIPMNRASCHETPDTYMHGRYKIIYTRAVMEDGVHVMGLDIIHRAFRTEPQAEAWVNETLKVAQFLEPPDKTFYGDVPVPVY